LGRIVEVWPGDALDRAFAHRDGPILLEFRTSLSVALPGAA